MITKTKNLKNLFTQQSETALERRRRGTKFSTLRNFRICAFTLAETLITLGIIGVVAALVLPHIVTRINEKVTVSKLKETYSMLNQAYKMAEVENDKPQFWFKGENNMADENQHVAFAQNLAKHLKLAENCINQTQDYSKKHCYIDAAKTNSLSYIRLENGVALGIRAWNGQCKSNQAFPDKNNTCGVIIAYTQPFNPNSKNGEQIFDFFLTNDGIYPYGEPSSTLKFERACNKSITAPYPGFDGGRNMYACTAWVIHNENMDYLHCDDLSWTGKHKCK